MLRKEEEIKKEESPTTQLLNPGTTAGTGPTPNPKLSNPDIHFVTSGQAITQDIMQHFVLG
ncbi:hypothetical protein FNH22_24420 [Fulvivirga sp. M361]|uniref:hypothetical protein n=1 Tax=Fulvivirga sp. M361 TaxID=2594266 RepID=UPI00117A17B4|nr:hypothetical protein [Fulvivirga sp. M361]TRX51284.1 hypothetical protein FNH22_24420 [Fulvivirga sp. M361]